jgi:hypothetical protein
MISRRQIVEMFEAANLFFEGGREVPAVVEHPVCVSAGKQERRTGGLKR